MPTISLKTRIQAPIEQVFDLSRSIDFHLESAGDSSERAIAGKTSGLLELGERVTWEAIHFGLRFRLTSEMVQMDRPGHFRDSMVEGPFRHFDHDHHFVSDGSTTVLTDTFDYSSPWGPLGRLVDFLVLENHMRRFLQSRNRTLQQVAESDAVERFLERSTSFH